MPWRIGLRLKRDLVDLPEDLATEPEEVAAVDSLTACLPRVLSELSPEDREAITLCDLEGMPQDEYARREGPEPAGGQVPHPARAQTPA